MAFTKVLGPGIHTQANIHSHNINSSGIITATKFVGPFDGTTIGSGTTIGADGINVTGIVTCTTLDVNGNADILGNLVVHGDTTTLNTTLREVELLHVDANSSVAAGIITQTGTGDILNLFDTSTEVFTVLDGGKVGIGYNAPPTKLSIRGTSASTDATVQIVGNSVSTLLLGQDADGGVIRGQGGNNALKFKVGGGGDTAATTGGTEALRIASNGNVRIGPAGAPNLAVGGGLEIERVGAATIRIEDTDEGSGFEIQNTGGVIKQRLYNNQPWTIEYGGGEKLRITSAGKVGIGTDSPLGTLDIFNANADASNTNSLGAQINAAWIRIGDVDAAGKTFSNGLGTKLYNQGTAHWSYGMLGQDFLITNTSGDGNKLFPSNRTAPFFIKSGGQVGVNTESPENADSLQVFGATTPMLTIKAGATGSDTSRRATLNLWTNGNKIYKLQADASDGALKILDSSTERLVIDTNGNLKISNNTAKIRMGSSNQLELYHNGTYGYLNDTTSSGTELRIAGRVVRVMDNDSSHTTAYFSDSAAKLYSGNSEKLTTTSTGIRVGGEVAASQDFPNYRPKLDLNFVAVKKLDSRLTYTREGPASYVDKNGLIKTVGYNTPRFDHDPITGESKGLLIEQSRYNMFAGTANMGSEHGCWIIGGSRGKRGPNVKGPDGKLTAINNIYNGTSGDLNIYYAPRNGANEMTVSNDTIYTCSIFIKGKPGNSYLTGVRIRTYNQNISVNYNVVNGTVVGVQENAGSDHISSSIVEYPDGWYRCIMTFRSDASGSQGFQFYVLSGGNNGALNSSGANGEAMYYWGAQLEAGSNATSFIPTDDTNDNNNGSKTTRGYEYLSMEGSDASDLYNALEGTLVAEWIATESEANQNLVSFHKDLGQVERIELRATASDTAKVRFEVVTGSSSTVSDSSISHGGIGDNTKAAFGFKKDDYAYSVNGSSVATDTSGNMPSDINSLMIGRAAWGSSWFDGYIKRILYYPKRLPNNQLITITS